MIKFIHCADLHLDDPLNLKVIWRHQFLKMFKTVLMKALRRLSIQRLKEEVDFVLIVGDLFDSENRTLRQVFLKEQFMRLEKEQIFVYISHGNHDPLTEKLLMIGQIMFRSSQIE